MKREQFFGRSIRNFSGKGSAAVAVAEAEAEAVLFSDMLTIKSHNKAYPTRNKSCLPVRHISPS